MRPATCVFALLAALLATGPAFAEADAARKEAAARFQEGLALHDANNDEEALLKFAQAYALNRSPAILFNLARSEQLSGKAVDAATHYRAVLREPEHPKITVEMRARARGYLAELVWIVAQVKIEARRDATLSMDGAPLEGAFDEAIAVAPGKHVVVARTGKDVESLAIEAIVGTTTPVRFRTEDILGPPRAETSSWTPGKTVAVAGLSAAAVGSVAASIGFFLAAGNRSEDVARLKQANPSCAGITTPGCTDLSDAADARVRDRSLGWVFLGAGIAASLGAVAATILWQPAARDDPKVALIPMFTSRSAGLGVVGHF